VTVSGVMSGFITDSAGQRMVRGIPPGENDG
jgi:hypothetical protein